MDMASKLFIFTFTFTFTSRVQIDIERNCNMYIYRCIYRYLHPVATYVARGTRSTKERFRSVNMPAQLAMARSYAAGAKKNLLVTVHVAHKDCNKA